MGQSKIQIIRHLQKAAEQGDIEASERLGWLYFHGAKPVKVQVVRGRVRIVRDPTQNYRKAVPWLRRAAEKGHVNSMHGLAICLLEGKGVKVQQAQGIRWLRKAAARGVNSAQYHLGLVLTEGRHGQKVERRKALGWFKEAAKSGDRDLAMNAREKVWQMYYHGKGVKRNYRAARLWIRKVLELGEDENALAAMIKIYRKGLGVKANPKKTLVLENRLRAF